MWFQLAALAGVAALALGGKRSPKAPAVAWEIDNAGNDGQKVYFDVFAPAGSFGAHQRLYVMRFSREGNGPPTYESHDATTITLVPQAVSRAVKDLGIKGAPLATRK